MSIYTMQERRDVRPGLKPYSDRTAPLKSNRGVAHRIMRV